MVTRLLPGICLVFPLDGGPASRETETNSSTAFLPTALGIRKPSFRQQGLEQILYLLPARFSHSGNGFMVILMSVAIPASCR